MNAQDNHFTQRHPVCVFFATLVLLTSASINRVHAASKAGPELSASTFDLVNAVNNVRAAYGLPLYSISPILMTTAQDQADYMAATGNVSHTGAGGSSMTDRLLAAGYPLAGQLSLGGFRSENITSGSEGMYAQTAVDQWSADSLHLTTMISPALTEIGAGVSVNAGRAYFVIDCARPTGGGESQPVIPSVVNGSSIPGTPLAQVAVVPVLQSTPDATGDLIHEVKAGQTLWQIAISYNTTIDEIKQLNNLVDNNIYPGTKLLIKKNVSISPSQTLTAVTTISPVGTSMSQYIAPTLAPARENEPLALPSRNIIGNVIGILVIALLGGGIFVWLGRIEK